MDNTEKRLFSAAKAATLPVILIWLIHLIKIVGGFHWNRYGVFAREVDGIAGIFLSPLLHGDFQHLFSNSIPLFFLVTLVLFFYPRVASISFVLIYFLTGLAVWLFSRGGVYHIGASGVVFGLVSFIFWNGVFRKSIKSVILSLVIIVMYGGGGYFAGMLPGKEGISWESHLFGALTGILVSFILKNNIEGDEKERDPWEGEDYTPKKYFLERGSFDKTMDQRRQEREMNLRD